MRRLAIISPFAALFFAVVAVGLFVSRPPDHSQRGAELEHKLQRATSEIATLKSELAMSKTNPGADLAPPPSGNSGATSGPPTKQPGGPRRSGSDVPDDEGSQDVGSSLHA
jgi:hypothetical protein